MAYIDTEGTLYPYYLRENLQTIFCGFIRWFIFHDFSLTPIFVVALIVLSQLLKDLEWIQELCLTM